MEIQIIERNQMFKNSLFSYWFLVFIIFLIFILTKIAFSFGKLISFEKEFSYISIFFGISGIIILIINLLSFKRTGILKIENKKINIENNGFKKEIELNSINSYKIKRIQGNIYKLSLSENILDIVLDKSTVTEFKKLLSESKS